MKVHTSLEERVLDVERRLERIEDYLHKLALIQHEWVQVELELTRRAIEDAKG